MNATISATNQLRIGQIILPELAKRYIKFGAENSISIAGRLCIVSLVAFLSVAPALSAAKLADRPSIVIIMVDDMGYASGNKDFINHWGDHLKHD